MRLKEIRKEHGLSAAKLSQISGVSLRTIQDIEARGDCRLSTARVLCDALGISLDELFPSKRDEPHKP